MDECQFPLTSQVGSEPDGSKQRFAEVIKKSKCGKYVRVKVKSSSDAIGLWVRVEEFRFLFIPQIKFDGV